MGPSGAGKSSVAAGMVPLGARLVADDIVLAERAPDGVLLLAPGDGPVGLELRGLGIVALPRAAPVPCAAVVVLTDAPGPRLPEPESWVVLDRVLPILRHPATADLPAKLMVWLAASEHRA